MARLIGICLSLLLLWSTAAVDGRARRKRQEERWTEEDEARRIEQIKKAERMEYQTEQSMDYGQQASIDYGQQVSAPVKEKEKMWCYHCASPMQSVNEDMRLAIRSFLSIRRTEYPIKAVHPDCTEPRNLTSLHKQYCLHSYCQTLVLTDHETASFFTIRGCAESFGAINEGVLSRQGDNTCQRLHDKLDIQECICRNRKYCFPGADRKNSSSLNPQHSLILALLAFLCLRFNF